MLLPIKRNAIPVLEDLGYAIEVVLAEAVELHDWFVLAVDLDLMASCCAVPEGMLHVLFCEGEGVATAGGLPAET